MVLHAQRSAHAFGPQPRLQALDQPVDALGDLAGAAFAGLRRKALAEVAAGRDPRPAQGGSL